ncbi:hypothetical protein J437_LFUL007619 [Ladona fulva]|uniref:Rieske domain-containing protein n=1 Tax=Ladona fulva TaxID=123851 RepID=A0A8K0K6Y0_LADFU|nr:hypothetical protein J437_LFUL007619 [Ladona fulva]
MTLNSLVKFPYCLIRSTIVQALPINFSSQVCDARFLRLIASYNDMGSSNTKNKGSADYVEGVVCQESALKENSMQVFELGPDKSKVLVVKQNGIISALGSKCSHYGAPLNTGALGNGVVRCPWHGACFNTKNGDIEDFPGMDSIPCYQVTVEKGGQVRVRARKDLLEANKRVKDMVMRDLNIQTSYVVIGGGGAGACCVETLRQEGFAGRIVLVTAENHLPYDRPKLSKILDATPAKISLRSPEFYEKYGIEVVNGTEAVGLDVEKQMVKLNKGEDLHYDKLFIATGSTPRKPDLPGVNLENVFTLRTVVDANKIAEKSRTKHVAIIGTSFIGMEIASYLSDKASKDKGVHFLMNQVVEGFVGGEGDESHLVKMVKLGTGDLVSAEVCVLGMGAIPNTNFLKDSGITLESGTVVVNENMETNMPNVFAGGDIACAPMLAFGAPVGVGEPPKAAIGHWQLASFHGRVAACNMVNPNSKDVKTVPFFWTAILGKSIRYSGYVRNYDDVVVNGDLEEMTNVVAYYCQGDRVLAIATINSDPVAAQFAERIRSQAPLMKADILSDNHLDWTKE